MKRTIIISSLLSFLTSLSYAQDKTEGRIQYEVTYHVHASLKPDEQHVKELIPEDIVDNANMVYKGQRFRSFHNEEFTQKDNGANAQMTIKMDEGSEKYIDLDSNRLYWVDRSKSPAVVIATKLKVNTVKKENLKDETKNILGYTCHKLILDTKNGGKFTMWYTNDLPLKSGTPLGPHVEQGVVLEVENKHMNFKAISIDFAKVEEKEVLPPAEMSIVKKDK
jgi:GLPGLI family protein